MLDAFIIEDIRRRGREREEKARLPLRPPSPPLLPLPQKEKENRSGIVDFTLTGKMGGAGGRYAYL